MFLNYLILAYGFFLLGSSSIQAVPTGVLKGHLKIISSMEVQLADQTQSQESAINYADYPLIILSKDSKKEIGRVVPDAKGNYRLELPPGDYILDVQGRAPGHLRAKPAPFTVVSNQTVHVDMTIDTGVR